METSRKNVNHVTCIIELVWELFFFLQKNVKKVWREKQNWHFKWCCSSKLREENEERFWLTLNFDQFDNKWSHHTLFCQVFVFLLWNIIFMCTFELFWVFILNANRSGKNLSFALSIMKHYFYAYVWIILSIHFERK